MCISIVDWNKSVPQFLGVWPWPLTFRGHLRSKIFSPFESPYMTSYLTSIDTFSLSHTKSDSILMFKRSSASDFIEHTHAQWSIMSSGAHFTLTEGCASVDYEFRIRVTLEWAPSTSRPRVSRRKNPYLSMKSGLRPEFIVVPHHVNSSGEWQLWIRWFETRSRPSSAAIKWCYVM